jgi:hypothetical protein
LDYIVCPIGIKYYEYILSVHPQRIIFNPGTENEELSLLAEKKGIKTLEACTLVLLSTNHLSLTLNFYKSSETQY